MRHAFHINRLTSLSIPQILAAATVAALMGLATTQLIIWQDQRATGGIEVVDGDTVRFDGTTFRLIGFDTPERGELARCDEERRRADAATTRLRALIAGGETNLQRVSCACRSGTEGTPDCNFGRLCGSLTISGRDVGQFMISEGHARSYICGRSGCPPRRPWC